ncbi:MAG: exodeoxyribonuclease VII small subunit [Chloroflexia bacterium]
MTVAERVDLPLEQAFAALEEIVRRLEGGDLPLEEALALYERGMALAQHCQELLDRAELRVTRLAEEAGPGLREEEAGELPF